MAGIHPETEIVPYLRGELSADERARVGAHLEGCAQCREAADASSAILSNLARVVDDVRDPDWAEYRAELKRKLPAELLQGPDSPRLDDAEWLQTLLGQVQPLLLDLLIKSECRDTK